MGLLFICTLWTISNTINLIFHAKYQDNEVIVAIPDGEVLEGSIPNAKMKLLLAWIEIHQDELMANWELAISGQQLYKIEPLR
jgi:Domain of unknown function (DUF4160)